MKTFPVMAAVCATAFVVLAFEPGVFTFESSSDYQAFCSSCHGVSGRGDGIVARSLAKKPANLTQLAKKNDGVFPAERILKVINGGAAAHGGSQDMPEWISVFEKSSESPSKAEAKARIEALVKYLESIQEKP